MLALLEFGKRQVNGYTNDIVVITTSTVIQCSNLLVELINMCEFTVEYLSD